MSTQALKTPAPPTNLIGKAWRFEPDQRPPIDWIRLRWALIAVAIMAVVLVHGVTDGWLGELYEWLWMNTTGRTWTSIMREQWWIYFVPSGVVAWLIALWIPRRYWGRVVIMTITYFVGFLGGHVLW